MNKINAQKIEKLENNHLHYLLELVLICRDSNVSKFTKKELLLFLCKKLYISKRRLNKAKTERVKFLMKFIFAFGNYKLNDVLLQYEKLYAKNKELQKQTISYAEFKRSLKNNILEK